MADLLALYRHAVRARLLDRRLDVLARAGRIGFHPDAERAEVVIVAASAATAPEDWVFPTPRDHAAALVRGVPSARYLAHAAGTSAEGQLGHATPGLFASRAHHVGAPSALLAQHLTEATGFAWAMQLRGDRGAVLAFLPETAAEAGDFHSAVNFAGVTKAPIVFLVRTDGSEAPAAPVEVADKGVAYGVTSAECSGDPRAVHDAVQGALARARAGEGPTLLEVRITTEPDPLEALRARLLEEGALTERDDFGLRRELELELDAGWTAAANAPLPALESLFQGVYADLPPHLRDQRDALVAARRQG